MTSSWTSFFSSGMAIPHEAFLPNLSKVAGAVNARPPATCQSEWAWVELIHLKQLPRKPSDSLPKTRALARSITSARHRTARHGTSGPRRRWALDLPKIRNRHLATRLPTAPASTAASPAPTFHLLVLAVKVRGEWLHCPCCLWWWLNAAHAGQGQSTMGKATRYRRSPCRQYHRATRDMGCARNPAMKPRVLAIDHFPWRRFGTCAQRLLMPLGMELAAGAKSVTAPAFAKVPPVGGFFHQIEAIGPVLPS